MIARDITGTRWSGPLFFCLKGPAEGEASEETGRPAMSAHLSRRLRCAVYTRKSTKDGLDQEYDSIDAQRDASHAYIVSQRAEGWIPLADDYDDPAYSGGHMDRPSLQRLLVDIEAGKIDIVVVYKIDRLTRSLTDFSRMIEVFERHGVSFVSVTQQFNTTTSMGRLMLNILLSFAQFEREVTGERIRDKIAASKRKGLWMGGIPSLGYDVDNLRLVPNVKEAKTVRHIFERFVELGSSTRLVKELRLDGVTSKAWTTQEGRVREGKPIDKSLIYKILKTGCIGVRSGTVTSGIRGSTRRSWSAVFGMPLRRSSTRTRGCGATPPVPGCRFCSRGSCRESMDERSLPGSPARRTGASTACTDRRSGTFELGADVCRSTDFCPVEISFGLVTLTQASKSLMYHRLAPFQI